MQENLTVTIDSQDQVFYGGIKVGEGAEAFDAALNRVPLSEVLVMQVRDERVSGVETLAEGEEPKAQEWVFPGDAYASVQDGMRDSTPTLYPLTPARARELRDAEHVYLEPAVQATVHPAVQTDWSAMREEIRRERARQAGITFETPDEIQPGPASDEPFRIRSLKEREAERLAAEQELKTQEETEAEVEQEAELLPHHERGEDIEWGSVSPVRDDPKDYLDSTVQFLTKAEQEEAPEYPPGHDSETSYLPGERLSTEPIAMQKARLKVTRVRNKVPLYVMGALALFAGSFWGINYLVNPPVTYSEVCVDSRTQLVTEQTRCDDAQDKSTAIAYVPQESSANLKDMDSLPEGSQLTEPTGRVVINKLGEE